MESWNEGEDFGMIYAACLDLPALRRLVTRLPEQRIADVVWDGWVDVSILCSACCVESWSPSVLLHALHKHWLMQASIAWLGDPVSGSLLYCLWVPSESCLLSVCRDCDHLRYCVSALLQSHPVICAFGNCSEMLAHSRKATHKHCSH